MKKKIVIIGAGIKGAAISATTMLSSDFQTILIDANHIGSGTTSTNHGRLHLGTAGWHKEMNNPDLVRRRLLASEFMREIPDALVSKKDALYCFEDETDAHSFKEFSNKYGIPYQIAGEINDSLSWIDKIAHRSILRVPEYSFNPAKLASRFANTCQNLGGEVRIGHRAIKIEIASEKTIIKLDNHDEISADFVVNTTSRWCMTPPLHPQAPQLDISWNRWKLLCLRTSALNLTPQPQEVIVIVDREKNIPSVIPHENWLTLDYNKTQVTTVNSPDDDKSGWSEFDPNDLIDSQNFATVSKAFEPIAKIDPCALKGNLYSLAGIQARLNNSTPGSQNQIFKSNSIPHYIVAFGGQASTSVLDAIEIYNYIRSHFSMKPTSRLEILHALKSSLSTHPIDKNSLMMWQKQG